MIRLAIMISSIMTRLQKYMRKKMRKTWKMRKLSVIQMMVRAMIKKIKRFVCIYLTFPSFGFNGPWC